MGVVEQVNRVEVEELSSLKIVSTQGLSIHSKFLVLLFERDDMLYHCEKSVFLYERNCNGLPE